jgi:hypothetical protein
MPGCKTGLENGIGAKRKGIPTKHEIIPNNKQMAPKTTGTIKPVNIVAPIKGHLQIFLANQEEE